MASSRSSTREPHHSLLSHSPLARQATIIRCRARNSLNTQLLTRRVICETARTAEGLDGCLAFLSCVALSLTRSSALHATLLAPCLSFRRSSCGLQVVTSRLQSPLRHSVILPFIVSTYIMSSVSRRLLLLGSMRAYLSDSTSGPLSPSRLYSKSYTARHWKTYESQVDSTRFPTRSSPIIIEFVMARYC